MYVRSTCGLRNKYKSVAEEEITAKSGGGIPHLLVTWASRSPPSPEQPGQL